MEIKTRKKDFLILLFFIGLTATLTQVMVIKELMSSFYGNEFSYIITFTTWLLLVVCGTGLCKKRSEKTKNKDPVRKILLLQLTISVLPLLIILSIRFLRNYFFPIGTLVNIPYLFLFTLALMSPFCIAYGFILCYIPKVLKEKEKAIARSYFVDNLGNIVGALLFTFVLGYLLNQTIICFIILLLNIGVLLFFSQRYKLKLMFVALILILITILFLSTLNLEIISLSKEFPNQKIILTRNSKFGHYVLTKTFDQKNLYQNGQLIFSSNQEGFAEELVHYALLQHHNPENILLIPNGNPDLLKEINKYPVKTIDYIEVDRVLIEILKNEFNLTLNQRVNLINQDPLTFLKQNQGVISYDAVILNLPAPSSLEFNRFYSREFFELLKKVSNNKTIVIFPLGHYENYLDKKTQLLFSSIKNTIKVCFRNVVLIPGINVYFIASDTNITDNPSQLISILKQKNISNTYVNEYYIKGQLTKDRINEINSKTNLNTKPNLNFNPRAFILFSLNWLSLMNFKIGLFLVILLLGLIVYVLAFIKRDPIRLAVFSSGFVASSIEIIVIFAFQVILGTLYYSIGMLIAAALIGITLGSSFAERRLNKLNKKTIIYSELLIALLLLSLPLIVNILNKSSSSIIVTLTLSLFLFIIYFFIALEFPVTGKLRFVEESKTTALLYNLDLVGALFGAIISSFILIPLLGILATCIILGIMKISVMLFVKFKT